MTRKIRFGLLVLGFLLFSPLSSGDGGEKGAEREKEGSAAALAAFDSGLSLADRRELKQSSVRDREKLTPRQRELYDERRRLREEAAYWDDVVKLKKDLLKMPGSPHEKDENEAEAIAKTAIRGFADLRESYGMLRPAIFHNLLVNMKLKEDGGLCWQWTRDLTKKLMGLRLKSYDLLWATARGGTMREHNTVVVVSRGRPLEDGIFLDGWTKSGKPFWMRVPDDRKHPWELGSYEGADMVPEPPPRE